MHKYERKSWGALLALLAVLPSACRKRAEAPPVPNLTMPGQPASTVPGNLKAEKEVSAQKGAVKLTLRVYRTKLKRGESLWAQIALTNVGQGPFLIQDAVFYGSMPFPDAKDRHSSGVYVRIIDQTGKTLRREPPWCDAEVLLPTKPSQPLTPDQQDLAEQLRFEKKLESEGVAEQERTRRLVEFVHLQGARHEEEAREGSAKRGRTLSSGQSIAQIPFAEDRGFICRPDAPGTPVGSFSEISSAYYHFEPGRYRVQAAYDYGFLREFVEKMNRRIESREHPGADAASRASVKVYMDADLARAVGVETPFVEFEVAR